MRYWLGPNTCGRMEGCPIPPLLQLGHSMLQNSNHLLHVFSSFWRCSFTSSRRPEGIFLGLSLKGFRSVTSILCLAASVHPISLSSNVKMSWYSANKFRAFSLFSSIQDLRPESSNFSNKIFLLSSMVSPAWPSLAHL